MLGRRLAAQQVTGPATPTIAELVRGSLAVQSQDPPMARWSLGVRSGLAEPDVLAALGTGEVVRTHVLRATWHWVHRDDVRWLLALTAPKIRSGMAARHRGLGIDDRVCEQAFAVLRERLQGNRFHTRAELAPLLPTTSYPRPGEVVGHLLFLAELDGLICSAPTVADGEHRYALLDEVVPPSIAVDRPARVAELVRRFVAGHGPTAEADLQRWCTLTLGEIRPVLAGPDFDSAVVDGVRLWWRAGASADHGTAGAWLLPVFDEVWLSHARPRFPRRPGHPLGEAHLNPAQQGGGVVVVDGRDIGVFTRTLAPGRVAIRIRLSPKATQRERAKTTAAANRFAGYLQRTAHIVIE